MAQQYTGSFQKLGSPAVYAATALVGVYWSYIAQGGGQVVIGLYERGHVASVRPSSL